MLGIKNYDDHMTLKLNLKIKRRTLRFEMNL